MDTITATATYHDAYAGPITVRLMPQRSGVFRWITERGETVDGLRRGLKAERMIAHAVRHALFSNIVVMW